jgi:hypothetical protein
MSDNVDASRRSEIAKKSRQTRQRKAEARQAEYRRRVFQVYHEGSQLEHYGPISEVLLNQPDATEPTKHFELEDVLADIAVRYRFLTLEDPDLSPDIDEQVGFGSLDLTVWRDGRLLAVVRRGDDGEPVVTRYDT